MALENDPAQMLTTSDYLRKRLGSNSGSQMKWLISSEVGHVYFRERTIYGGGHVHHSYGNVAQQPQFMTSGTTHISIGFADLQELLI